MNNTIANKNDNEIVPDYDLEKLIEKLKDQDIVESRQLRRLYVIYIALIVFMTGLYIVNPDAELGLYQRLTGVIFIVALTMMALIFRKHYKDLRKLDYAQSILNVLKNAEKRYKFWEAKRITMLAIFILLIDIAVSMVFNGRYLPSTFTWIEKTLIVQAFYIPIILTSFIIGWFQWRKLKKPIMQNIKALITELENE